MKDLSDAVCPLFGKMVGGNVQRKLRDLFESAGVGSGWPTCAVCWKRIVIPSRVLVARQARNTPFRGAGTPLWNRRRRGLSQTLVSACHVWVAAWVGVVAFVLDHDTCLRYWHVMTAVMIRYLAPTAYCRLAVEAYG